MGRSRGESIVEFRPKFIAPHFLRKRRRDENEDEERSGSIKSSKNVEIVTTEARGYRLHDVSRFDRKRGDENASQRGDETVRGETDDRGDDFESSSNWEARERERGVGVFLRTRGEHVSELRE